MPQETANDFYGRLILQKTDGVGAVSVGTRTLFPPMLIDPSNPLNNNYPMLMSGASTMNHVTLGKRTPAIVFRGLWKPSYMTPANILSWIGNVNSVGDSDEYAMAVIDGEGNVRVYDGCRCAGITVAWDASTGPASMQGIMVEMAWLARYGDSDAPVPTTISTSGLSDYGQTTGVNEIDFNSTADAVAACSFSLVRVQKHLGETDQTLFMKQVASGPPSGGVQLTQYSKSTIVPSTGFTVKIGTSSGTRFDFNIYRELTHKAQVPDFAAVQRAYSLVDLAGSGSIATIAAF